MAHAKGFHTMPPAMQNHFCNNMILWLQEKRGRLLEQRDMGQWKELKGGDATKYCHKQATAESNKLLKALIREIEHLKLETKFGAWRRMSIHQKIIPRHLENLEKVILSSRAQSFLPAVGRGNVWRVSPVNDAVTGSFVIPRPRAIYTRKGHRLERTRSVFYPIPEIMEPFRGAWLEVSDDVEGKYNGVHNGKNSSL